eukprot:NODE_6975_length_1620_cov_4.170797.p1 GENE.NODE_6975_length_1620_cov_4.170797~~NODE_6975_length_1620_cov_4.170797.p1  ORF type:complete len:355 (+),score=35.58 NODE_6975_length_1620_cov_4.170797:96-1160(+)
MASATSERESIVTRLSGPILQQSHESPGKEVLALLHVICAHQPERLFPRVFFWLWGVAVVLFVIRDLSETMTAASWSSKHAALGSASDVVWWGAVAVNYGIAWRGLNWTPRLTHAAQKRFTRAGGTWVAVAVLCGLCDVLGGFVHYWPLPQAGVEAFVRFSIVITFGTATHMCVLLILLAQIEAHKAELYAFVEEANAAGSVSGVVTAYSSLQADVARTARRWKGLLFVAGVLDVTSAILYIWLTAHFFFARIWCDAVNAFFCLVLAVFFLASQVWPLATWNDEVMIALGRLRIGADEACVTAAFQLLITQPISLPICGIKAFGKQRIYALIGTMLGSPIGALCIRRLFHSAAG